MCVLFYLSVKNSSPVYLYFSRQPIAKCQRETKDTSLILCNLEGRQYVGVINWIKSLQWKESCKISLGWDKKATNISVTSGKTRVVSSLKAYMILFSSFVYCFYYYCIREEPANELSATREKRARKNQKQSQNKYWQLFFRSAQKDTCRMSIPRGEYRSITKRVVFKQVSAVWGEMGLCILLLNNQFGSKDDQFHSLHQGAKIYFSIGS